MSESKIQQLRDWFIKEFAPEFETHESALWIYRGKKTTYNNYWIRYDGALYICRPDRVEAVIKKTRADFEPSFRAQKRNPLHPPNTYYLD